MTQEILKSPKAFRRHITQIFSRQKTIEFGYDDGYYWEIYYVRQAKDGVKIVFDIGSGSGYIPCSITTHYLTWDEFYQLVLNKRFHNQKMSLIDLINEAIKDF